MSHSKYNKRGHSLYLDNWNPNAKKYINECSVCGHKGYSPAIEQPDFLSDTDKDPFTFSVNKAIYEELTKTFSLTASAVLPKNRKNTKKTTAFTVFTTTTLLQTM